MAFDILDVDQLSESWVWGQRKATASVDEHPIPRMAHRDDQSNAARILRRFGSADEIRIQRSGDVI
jgi:hypothetical protein